MLNAFCLHINKSDVSPVRARFSTAGADQAVHSIDSLWKMAGQLRSTGKTLPCFAVDGADWAICLGESGGSTHQDSAASHILSSFKRQGVRLFRELPRPQGAVLMCGSVLYLFAPKTPGASIFYQRLPDGGWGISTELKAFRALNSSIAMRDVEEASMHWEPWVTPLHATAQVPPGHFVRIDLQRDTPPQLLPYWSPYTHISRDDSATISKEILTHLSQVISAIPGDSVTSLVSGGLDSSLITALAKQSGKTVHTFSVGTSDNNEFEHAGRFAQSIHSIHREVCVDTEELVRHYAEIVWLVEHPFSTYLEYLLPGHVAMKHIEHSGRPVISGYGADVLFGGFARPEISPLELDTLVASEYQSCLWAHETSQTLGGIFGVPIYYPYFEPSVVQHAMSIPTELKHRDRWEKWILRTAASTTIDGTFAWRRKLGIHQSTGTQSILDPLFGGISSSSSGSLRDKKDRLSYSVLKLVLCEGCSPDEVQLSELVKEIGI